uniref:5'-3' exoribonuclease n=1 Tax=Panagrolaimus davidi TaxID=227884 RepID=A0A914QRI2_9BILA
MGVPSFFRWLQRKYPSIITNAVEERKTEINGTEIPSDCTKPNPNNQEFDNLYLDMNGIIHPCTHPENRPAPKSEEEMFVLIFEYIDRLFSIVRPRRLLYMAIDGVAPRAKMNQQRSRRFRAAKEAIEKEEEIHKIREKLEAEGIPLPPAKKAEEKFDSNCITPGTPFMDRLAIALRYYVHKKISSDPAWENIQVILSDANAPGEGEHKIMDFIRRQRASSSHDPNTVHCLCGADADLIMLGLATHEANFNILREEFVPNQPRPCELCHQYGHGMKDCQGLAAEDDKVSDVQANPIDRKTNFIFIRLPILREYLERDLKDGMMDLPFEFDLERAIDDWVFMCFFVGNDFLPHLPSLEIRENAIDRLIRLYKQMVRESKGWLTDAGEVSLDRVQIMMKGLGEMEDQIFVQRQKSAKRWKKIQRKRSRQSNMPQNDSLVAPSENLPEKMTAKELIDVRKEEKMNTAECKEAEMKLKSLLNIPSESHRIEVETPRHTVKRSAPVEEENSGNDSTTDPPPTKIVKIAATATSSDDDSEEEEENLDGIDFHKPGWKSRYYLAKFNIQEDDVEFRRKIARDYVEGLCWVLKYYYQGCPSWDWFFPHHYAPFASDFDAIADFVPDFSKPTKPFNPFEQLMAVFPAASRAHIPEAWHSLMTEADSPLSEFYPTNFKIDLNGKKFAWQGVVLLPFVDQKKLLEELSKVYSKLTDDEKRRNIRGVDRIFVKNSHTLFTALNEVFGLGKESNFEVKKDADGSVIREWVPIDPSLANGMAGEIAFDKDAVEIGGVFPSIIHNNVEYMNVDPNCCMMASYRDPVFPNGFKFSAVLLEGVAELERTLKHAQPNDEMPISSQPPQSVSHRSGSDSHA